MMNHPFYDTKIHLANHRRFGGFVYESDFYTNYKKEGNRYGSSIAQRIESDWKFDEQCKRKGGK